jgi:hypothetical protein
MHNKQAACSDYVRPDSEQQDRNRCKVAFLRPVVIMARLLLYSTPMLRHHPSFAASVAGKAGSLLEDVTGLISN